MTLRKIKYLCLSKQLDCKEVYHSSQVLLSVYRDVILQSLGQIDDMYDNISEINSDFSSDDLELAFDCFSNFAYDYNLREFEVKIISLHKTKIVIDIIDNTMFRVYKYPVYWPMYHEILSKAYL